MNWKVYRVVHICLLLQADQGWLGGVDYIRNLILAVGNLPPEDRQDIRLTLLSDDPIDSELNRALSPHLHQLVSRNTEFPPRTFVNRLGDLVKRHFFGQSDPRFARFCLATGIDFAYPFQGTPGRQTHFSSASWIADFQHKHLPRFFTPEEIQLRNKQFNTIANVAPRVVLSSESAATDFHHYFPDQASKVHILRFAVSPDPKWLKADPLDVQSEYDLSDRFFLICNQFWQHKNHLLVFEALRRLKEQGVRPNLVCTGHLYDYRSPGFTNEVLQTIHRYGLHTQIKLLGIIPREHQIQLMRRCMAIIQPSLFEGWSTIVEFAKALGRPLILSDLSVHQEQYPRGLFFRRDSPAELAALMSSNWRELNPGPDSNDEDLAYRNAESRAADFARNFLEMARISVNRSHR